MWRTRVFTGFVLALTAFPLAAQTVDPTGHWEGSVQIPDAQFALVIDIAREGTNLVGTIGFPSERLVGVPLQKVVLDGKTITFQARRDQVFSGALSDDGTWIVGELAIEGYKPPFTMKRTGDARVEPPAASPAISADLAGRWVATPSVGGQSTRLTLTLANRANGTSTGLLGNEKNGDLQIPVTIAQAGRDVTLTLVGATGGAFTGTLNATGTELTGAWKDGTTTFPVAFRREAVTRP